MQTDWKKLAQARELTISEADLTRIAPILDALEAAFQPLLERIPADREPAITLSEPALDPQ